MAIQVQYRRGTGAENDSFTGALGEISVDTTAETLRVHDGSTVGGSNLATTSYVVSQIGNLSSSSISYGTSNVAILSNNGSVTSYVAGVLVLTTSATGLASTAGLTATGTVEGGTLTDGTLTSTAGTITSGVAATFSGNVVGGNLNTGAQVVATGNVSGGNLISAGTVTCATLAAIGLITAANLTTSANVTASGNVSGTYLLGDGSAITGLPAGYGDSDVAAYLPTYAGNLGGTLTTVAQTNITSTGSLSAGAIEDGFGSIYIGIENVTAGNILCGAGNAVGNIGNATTQFNTVHAQSTSAQYADVAEYYLSDNSYDPGTVLVFGGNSEVTDSTTSHDARIAGVVSESPALLMNNAADPNTRIAVALLGRVQCKVIGTINKGDRLVASAYSGIATLLVTEQYTPGCIIGKALESYSDEHNAGTIEIVVGRL